MEYKKISFLTVIYIITKLNTSLYRQIFVKRHDGSLDKIDVYNGGLIDFINKEYYIYKDKNQYISDTLTEKWK